VLRKPSIPSLDFFQDCAFIRSEFSCAGLSPFQPFQAQLCSPFRRLDVFRGAFSLHSSAQQYISASHSNQDR
jgi:hypothetical protein